MLRIYFLQQWFNLSDPQAEDAIYDSESMRRFARVELGDDVVPDETTILRFRHLLEKHRLTAAIFEAVKELLTAKRLLLQERDDRRCDDHRGAQLDEECGAGARSRDEADAQGERVALRDEAARRDGPEGARAQRDRDACGRRRHHAAARSCCTARSASSTGTRRTGRKRIGRPSRPRGVRYRVNRRAAAPRQPLSERWRAINRARSRTRARGEHPFHVVKRLWGFAKVRYRGIAKNLARAFSLFALANLYLVRRQLLPPRRGASCEYRDPSAPVWCPPRFRTAHAANFSRYSFGVR